jgi:ferritin-like metal-binding protein YciE
MDPKTLTRTYLDEAHAMEAALVTNLTAHIALTTDPDYRALLERHLAETREQVRTIDRRRKAVGRSQRRNPIAAGIGLARDIAGQALVLTKGPLDGIRTTDQRERMLKNAKDECATEALEIATYDVLETVAKAAGDRTTAKLAADHRAQEERMLADLRAVIGRLAVDTFESRTGEDAVPQVKAAATRKLSTVG